MVINPLGPGENECHSEIKMPNQILEKKKMKS